MIKLIAAVLILMSCRAGAAEFKLVVQDGEKQTSFAFDNAPERATLVRTDAAGTKTLSLDKKDADYLNSRFAELTKFKSNDVTLCPETFLAVSAPDIKKPLVACVRSPLEFSQKMVKLANLLQLRMKMK